MTTLPYEYRPTPLECGLFAFIVTYDIVSVYIRSGHLPELNTKAFIISGLVVMHTRVI